MRKTIVILSLLVFSIPAWSTVWVRNGNFSLDFTDANEGNGLELTRYYNSLGFTKSFFGYGWGTTVGARLGSVAGALVMVEEIPGGGRSHYVLSKDLGKLADRIITLSKASSDNPDLKLKLKKKLLQDPMLLFEFAKRYKIEGVPAEGSVLECLERSDETIKKIRTGYMRYRNDGTIDEFDNAGRILRQKFKSGRFLLYSYDQRGNLQSVRDQLGRIMKFYINDKGLLERVQVGNNRVALYKYDERDDLIESTDVDGNTFRYRYNSYHKMIELTSLKGPNNQPQRWSMKYEGDTGRIVYQKTPDGWETYTEYSSDESKSQYYEAVSVVKRLGNEVKSEKYEFWKRPKPDGSTYTYKMRQVVDNKEKTVTYTMCCGTPLVVNDDGKVTRFEYDKDGFLKKKVFSDGRIVEVRYDNKSRIEYIINNGRPYRFKYNQNSQMVFAGSDLIKFKIDYDGNGNVAKITDNRGNAFSLIYDQRSRLTEISSKFGALVLSYASDGSTKITSRGGTKENLSKIRKAYQEYLDLMMVFTLIDLI